MQGIQNIPKLASQTKIKLQLVCNPLKVVSSLKNYTKVDRGFSQRNKTKMLIQNVFAAQNGQTGAEPQQQQQQQQRQQGQTIEMEGVI